MKRILMLILLNFGLNLGWNENTHDYGDSYLMDWHDFRPLQVKSEQQIWLKYFMHSLILRCTSLYAKSYINLKNTRNKLRSERCFQVCRTTYTYHKTDSPHKLLDAPCGTIKLFHPDLIPSNFTWQIALHNSYIVNCTFVAIDILHNDVACKYNSLVLREEGSSVNRDIVKLCGRSRNRVFYSRRNSVILTATLTHLHKPITQLLHLQYQACEKSLSQYVLHIRRFEAFGSNMGYLGALTYKTGLGVTTVGAGTYYKYVKLDIEIKSCWRVNQGIYVYDGPTSKSPLIFSSAKQIPKGVKSLFSSLLHLTIVTENIDKLSCVANYSIVSRTISFKNLTVTGSELRQTFHYGAQNMLEFLHVKVSSNLFVNIKLKNFEYTGNTEHQCLYGGVLFSEGNVTNHGPFCGAFGKHALQDTMLGGITFERDRILIILMLYFQTSVKMSGEFIFSASKCQGIVNICDLYDNMRNRFGNEKLNYQAKYFYFWYISPKLYGLRVSEDRKACVVIQTLQFKVAEVSCEIKTSGAKGKIHANLSYVASDPALSKQCYKPELLEFVKRYFDDKLDARYFDASVRLIQDFIVLPPNSGRTHSSVSSSFIQRSLAFSFESSCSQFLNDGYALILSRDKCGRNYFIEDDSCSVIEPLSTPDTCYSNLFIRHYHGIYCVKIVLSIIQTEVLVGREHLLAVMVLKFDFTNLLRCKQSGTFHLLTLQVNSIFGVNYFTWNITKPHLSWALDSRLFDLMGSVHIRLLLNGKFKDGGMRLTSSENLPEFTLSTLRQYEAMNSNPCPNISPSLIITTNTVFHRSIPFKQLKQPLNLLNKTEYDIGQGSYIIFSQSVSSWNSARQACGELESKLLSINSDLEMKTLQLFLREYLFHPITQLVFLDMQVSNKVREINAIHCKPEHPANS